MSRAQHEEEPKAPWSVRRFRKTYDELPPPFRVLLVLAIAHGFQLAGIIPPVHLPSHLY